MKNTLLKLIVILILLMLFIVANNTVYAAELVDFSKAVVTVTYSDDTHLQPSLTITGVTFNPNNGYSIQYTNSATATLEESKWHSIENGKSQDGELMELLPLSEDIYVWFSEADTEEIYEFQTPIKLEKPSQLPLGQRISAVFTTIGSNIKFSELPGNEPRNIKYKIGQVKDSNLLKILKENGTSKYDELLNFSKNTNESKEGIADLSNFMDFTFTDINFVNNGYYFVYLELDTMDGKYIPLYDIGLYQAEVDNYGGYILNNTNGFGFEWKIDDDISDGDDKTNTENVIGNNNTTENTENITQPNNTQNQDNSVISGKLPQTGTENLVNILIIGALIAISILFFIKWKKYKIM